MMAYHRRACSCHFFTAQEMYVISGWRNANTSQEYRKGLWANDARRWKSGVCVWRAFGMIWWCVVCTAVIVLLFYDIFPSHQSSGWMNITLTWSQHQLSQIACVSHIQIQSLTLWATMNDFWRFRVLYIKRFFSERRMYDPCDDTVTTHNYHSMWHQMAHTDIYLCHWVNAEKNHSNVVVISWIGSFDPKEWRRVEQSTELPNSCASNVWSPNIHCTLTPLYGPNSIGPIYLLRSFAK